MPQANNNTTTPALPRALSRDARRKVEHACEAHLAAVEALTAFLDVSDRDTNREPDLAGTSGDDREGDPADPPAHGIDDNELDGSGSPFGHDDAEPELGWPAMIDQERALKSCAGIYVADRGNLHGYGYVHDGGEPSLGSVERIDQTGWAYGNSFDYKATTTVGEHA